MLFVSLVLSRWALSHNSCQYSLWIFYHLPIIFNLWNPFFLFFLFFFFWVGEEGFPFDTRNAQVERIQAHTHTHEAVCSKIYSGMPPDCRHFSVVSVKQYDTPWFKNGTSCIRVSDMSSDFKAIRETENIVGIGLNSHFRNGVIFPRVAFEGHNYYE